MPKTKTKAWVVFSGQADLPWLKILKDGYRHCYVLLNDGMHWITIDPLSNTMEVTVHDLPLNFDLPLWMKNNGHLIVPANIHHHETQAPWMLFSCVEVVKRVLGIHRRFIITPWQLYKHLQKEQTAQIFQPDSCKGDFAWEA